MEDSNDYTNMFFLMKTRASPVWRGNPHLACQCLKVRYKKISATSHENGDIEGYLISVIDAKPLRVVE